MSEEAELFDCVIVGAGLFGLHSARTETQRKKRVLVIEQDEAPFKRASLINQARVHLGYHYPRSVTTGLPSVEHFNRFCKEFKFAILDQVRKVYAISNRNSLTSPGRFEAFCKYIGIPLYKIDANEFFIPGAVSSAYETSEAVFDGAAIGNYIFDTLCSDPLCHFYFTTTLIAATRSHDEYIIKLSNDMTVRTKSVINCSYSGINQIQQLFGQKCFDAKYELTEILLGKVPSKYRNVGITIMDGPFFSLMPWGNGNQHSLTAVQYTPRKTSWEQLPTFSCMKRRLDCTPAFLKNCDSCPEQPVTSRDLMIQTAKKYLIDEFHFAPEESHFAVKTVLSRSEVDDARPTLIEKSAQCPDFISVLSGKINTLYEYEKTLYGSAHD